MAQTVQTFNRAHHFDANLDKGYGRLTPKFHSPRSYNQYPEPPERDLEAESQIDDETYHAVLSRLLAYSPNDMYAKNKTDPFSYVGGATKLGEVASGMVPFPRMYKQKQAVSGGTAPKYPTGPTVGFQSRARPTGTKKGFSSAPYPNRKLGDDMEAPAGLVDILTTDEDERHINLIKKMVNLIHLEQER